MAGGGKSFEDQVIAAIEEFLSQVFGLGVQIGVEETVKQAGPQLMAAGVDAGAKIATPVAHRIGVEQGARAAVPPAHEAGVRTGVAMGERAALARVMAAVQSVAANPVRVDSPGTRARAQAGERDAQLAAFARLAEAVEALPEEAREELRLSLVEECAAHLAEHSTSELAGGLYVALTGHEYEPPKPKRIMHETSASNRFVRD